MYRGYNLDLDKEFYYNSENTLQEYKAIGNDNLIDYKAHCENQLQQFVISENTIDGTKLQNDWFPQIDADVFISHSHIDEDLALALSGWLSQTFELKCFVDSAVWGYAEDLLDTLNDDYSNKRKKVQGGFLYSYELCNRVSQHVYMMLNVALQKMIDNTEVTFVLNTDNFASQFINNDKKINVTYSPFIYAELTYIETVRLKPKASHRNELMHTFEAAQKDPKLRYEIESLENLSRIDKKKLNQWKEDYLNKPRSLNRIKEQNPLDVLYDILDRTDF